MRLTCDTSCSHTSILWYENRKKHGSEKIKSATVTSAHSFSCAVKGFEDLHSPEVCEYDPTYGLLEILQICVKGFKGEYKFSLSNNAEKAMNVGKMIEMH